MVKVFKNGDLNVRFVRSDLTDIRAGHVDEMEVLSLMLEGEGICLIDCPYDLGNDSEGVDFYSSSSDRLYMFDMSDLEVLRNGCAVKMFARVPDDKDRARIGEWFGN